MPSNSFTNNDFIFSPVVLTVGGSPWLGFQESEGRRVLYALKTWPLMAARVDVLSAHNSNLQAEANALADLAVGLSNQAAAAAEVYRSREAKSTLRAVLVAGGVLAIGILGGFVVAKITP